MPIVWDAKRSRKRDYVDQVRTICMQILLYGPQDAQKGCPARPQGDRRLKGTLGVRCRESSD